MIKYKKWYEDKTTETSSTLLVVKKGGWFIFGYGPIFVKILGEIPWRDAIFDRLNLMGVFTPRINRRKLIESNVPYTDELETIPEITIPKDVIFPSVDDIAAYRLFMTQENIPKTKINTDKKWTE
jgi:hypothetical protein